MNRDVTVRRFNDDLSATDTVIAGERIRLARHHDDDPRVYQVFLDGTRIGYVGYYEGDRGWRGRVDRGRRHYRGNGWVWGSHSMLGNFRLAKDTRHQAIAELIKDVTDA